MLDLGWSELLIIGVVALIVVGPKDLPKMLRTLGQYAGRARSIARDFQRSMDDAARQADIEELREVKKGLDDMRDAQYKMQRDMGQSFLDGPAKSDSKKSDAKKSESEKPAVEPVENKAKPAKAKAEAAPASAAKSTARSARKSTGKVAEPKAEPGNVSGA